MARGHVNHIDLTVSNVQLSHVFYDRLLKFLGFVGGEAQGDNAGGWIHPRTGFNIAIHLAKAEFANVAHNRYAPGLHHLAFDADSRADVDQLHALLVSIGAKILDPPGEYYGKDYYAVFFADPDGLKLEFVHLARR
jgi:glyoxylase I family protein